MTALPESPTRLRGSLLLAARIVCAVLVVLTLGLFIASLPARADDLRYIALRTQTTLQQLSFAEERALLTPKRMLDFYPVYGLGVEIGLMGLLTLSAGIMLWRKSDDWMALFLAAAQLSYGLYVIPPLDSLMAGLPAWRLPGNIIQAFGIGMALIFFYLFPDGRFVPRWTRYLVVVWLAWMVMWVAFPKSPFNLSNPFRLTLPWYAVLMVWWFTGLFAQFYRYQRMSNLVQRQQTKYVIFGVAFAVVGYGLYIPARYVIPLLDPSGTAIVIYRLIGIHVFLLFVSAVPLTITFSILRYRLWDIDVFINRTLVYVVLMAALVAVYFGSALALQELFVAVTGEKSDLALVASTLASAVLFNPLRVWVQNWIDRRFYRHKYVASNILAAFSGTLRQQIDLERMMVELVDVIGETMQPRHVSLWLRRQPGRRKTQV